MRCNRILAAVGALFVVLIVVLWRHADGGAGSLSSVVTADAKPHSGRRPERAAHAAAPRSTEGSVDRLATGAGTDEAAKAIQACFNRVSVAANGPAAFTSIQQMMENLSKLESHRASLAIEAFLDSGRDVPTGLDFIVAGRGNLAEWPTFRVALLDLWGQVEVSEAAEYGRKLVRSFESPEEWALSLRNLARASSDLADDAFLRGKSSEMIQHAAWAQNPSKAYLLAYDFVVATRNLEAVPTLERQLRERSEEPVAWASYLALDRLGAAHPEAVCNYLLGDPRRLGGHPEIRADLFARCDVAAPPQRRAVEAYLLREDLSDVEVIKFVHAFPLNSQTISHNLVTTEQRLTLPQMMEGDRAALAVVDGWLADPRFQGRHGELLVLRDRLAGFLTTAK